jgi:hypothetical protein
MAFVAIFGTPAGSTSSTLLLKVTNLAGISNETLARAQREVAVVYRDAGVKTVWIGNGVDPADGAAAMRFEIVILEESPVAEATTGYRFRYDNLGYVNLREARVYAFWSRVYEEGVRYSRDGGEILGLVVAHELGHLLLSDGHHSAGGLMHEHFNLADRAPVRLTKGEIARIGSAFNRLRHVAP